MSPRPGAAPCPPVRGRPRVPPSRPDTGPPTGRTHTHTPAHPKLVLLQTRRQVRPRSSRHHLFNHVNAIYRTGPSIPGAPLGPPRPPPDPPDPTPDPPDPRYPLFFSKKHFLSKFHPFSITLSFCTRREKIDLADSEKRSPEVKFRLFFIIIP